jgi:hypothetical protein
MRNPSSRQFPTRWSGRDPCQCLSRVDGAIRPVLDLNGVEREILILLVRPLGFEPKTLCLEGVCSINRIDIHIVLDFIGNKA